jgi:K+-transporting ATPase ATPase C chain
LGPAPVPVDAATTSASGLDPDISPENAARQVARIAAARHRSTTEVQHVLDANTSNPVLGFIGEKRVNVLAANMALDALPATALSAK